MPLTLSQWISLWIGAAVLSAMLGYLLGTWHRRQLERGRRVRCPRHPSAPLLYVGMSATGANECYDCTRCLQRLWQPVRAEG